jgi:uncharacterized protein YndB with AHSA1/START domain
MSSDDCIRVSTLVAVPPDAAFTAFTADIGRWWRRAPRFGGSLAPRGELRFEGKEGGALIEHDEAGGRRFELGRFRVWEPGKRLVLTFRPSDFAADEATEVEVRFTPHRGGTRVVLEHRGLNALRKDHPFRRGFQGDAFESMVGYFWAEPLTAYRAQCSGLI